MALQIVDNNQYSFHVTGNTLPYKEEFKKYGGTWNRNAQAWRFQITKKLEVTELVNKINSVAPPFSIVSSSATPIPSKPLEQSKPAVNLPQVGQFVNIQLNEIKFQAKVIALGDIIELGLENGQKLYATVILGKLKIYDPNMINEVTF